MKTDFTKMPTKQLLGIKNKLDRRIWSQCEDEYDDLKKERDIVMAVLSTRPHILSSSQSLLVRKMSKKAGKKLTLKEAQSLARSSKR